MTGMRQACVILLGCLALCLCVVPMARAQNPQSFTIGTGGSAGTYFPIGAMIGNAISAPPGSRPCADGGACGVPGLTATAISTNGSVANVEAISDGTLDSGFAQSDVVTWAATGTGIFRGQARNENLRAIANLYPESIHIVATAESGIASLADLAGKRISLDEPGSGTLVEARIILGAAGLTEEMVIPSYLKAEQAAQQMLMGRLDAFFFVGGYPSRAITDLAAVSEIVLVPIDDAALEVILGAHEFFWPDMIPGGTYQGVADDVPTISVAAQWVTSVDQSDALIYAITQALWNDTTRNLLDNGHLKGRQITLDTALDGIGIPLHPGAQKYYMDQGLLN